MFPPPLGPTAAGPLPVTQARATDREDRGHHLPLVAWLHQLPRLGVNLTAAHSPATFLRISISSAFRPSERANCPMRRSFSLSAAAALLPPSAALAP